MAKSFMYGLCILFLSSCLIQCAQGRYFSMDAMLSERRDSFQVQVCKNTSGNSTVTFYHKEIYTIAETNFVNFTFNALQFQSYKFVTSNGCSNLTMDTATKGNQSIYIRFNNFAFGINELFCNNSTFEIGVCKIGSQNENLEFYHTPSQTIASTDFANKQVNLEFRGYSLDLEGKCAIFRIVGEPRNSNLFVQYGNTKVKMSLQTCPSASNSSATRKPESSGFMTRGNLVVVILFAIFTLFFQNFKSIPVI